jgi:hypothetical protein
LQLLGGRNNITDVISLVGVMVVAKRREELCLEDHGFVHVVASSEREELEKSVERKYKET